MPSDKRARKHAARDAKRAEEERRRKRRSLVRRVIVILIAVGIAVGVFALASSGSKNAANKKSTTTTTTTTTAPTTTTTAATGPTTTLASSAYTTSADCPANFTAKLKKPSWSKAPAMTIDTSKTYTATMVTDVGTMTIALDPKTAPITVNNFVFLAEQHFYDCTIFHRVIPGFMDQGGDPTGTGTGGPGYQYTDKGPATASPQYPIGSIAMANSSSGTTDPSTNGSQFFIVTGSEGETLPPDYVLFGQVTSGIAVANQINADGNSDPSAGGVPPKVTHRVISISIATS